MKQKTLSIALLLIFSFCYSFAADNIPNELPQDKNELVKFNTDNVEDIEQPTTKKVEKKMKTNAVKRFFKKAKIKLADKLKSNNILSPQRILVLMIIGFLLLVPGMVLAAIGVALIPAIILAVLGGTLMILGVLLGK